MSTSDVFYAPNQPTRAASTSTPIRPAYRLWLAVILAHGVLLLLAGLSHTRQLSHNATPIIQARLLPAAPAQQSAVSADTTSPSTTSTSAAPALNSETVRASAPEQNQAADPQPAKPTAMAEAVAPATAGQPPATPQTHRFDPHAARQFIQQRHQQEVQGLAQADAQARRNPVIIDPRKGQPEVFVPTVAKKMVRCDNAFNNVVAALSRAAGGTVRCSQPPDFNEFIDQRRAR